MTRLHYTITHTYNAGQCTHIYLESSNTPRPPLGGRGMVLVRVLLGTREGSTRSSSTPVPWVPVPGASCGTLTRTRAASRRSCPRRAATPCQAARVVRAGTAAAAALGLRPRASTSASWTTLHRRTAARSTTLARVTATAAMPTSTGSSETTGRWPCRRSLRYYLRRMFFDGSPHIMHSLSPVAVRLWTAPCLISFAALTTASACHGGVADAVQIPLWLCLGGLQRPGQARREIEPVRSSLPRHRSRTTCGSKQGSRRVCRQWCVYSKLPQCFAFVHVLNLPRRAFRAVRAATQQYCIQTV
jgi:hypothetical protein